MKERTAVMLTEVLDEDSMDRRKEKRAIIDETMQG